MDQLIDKINIERILLATHEYLLTKPVSNQNKSDEVGIRITKTIVNELVKIKREEIWDYYGGVDAHTTQDVYIKKWIEIILMSLSGGEPSQRPSTAPEVRPSAYTGGLSPEDNEQLQAILQEAQCGNQFRADQAYKSLLEFSNDFPNLDLDAYLKANCTVDVYSAVLTGIMKAKKRKQLTGKSARNVGGGSFKAPLSGSGLRTPNKFNSSNDGGESAGRFSTLSKLQSVQNKMSDNDQELDGDDSAGSSLKPGVDNKLGSSIAAMNSSITEKWRKINSKGLSTPSGLNNTVGGGFKSKALQDKSTLDKDSNDNEGDADASRSSKTKLALQARLNEVKVSTSLFKSLY